MSSLRAAYINEIYKLSKRKKLAVACILSVAAVLVAALIVGVANNFMGIRITGESEFSILVLSVLNYTLIPLFTIFICIDMVGGEFSNQTMKMVLTRPVSRVKVYLSKALAAATFIIVNLLFIMVTSLIISLFIKGTLAGIGRIFVAYVASFFPLFVFALFTMIISTVFRGTGSAFFLSILCFLLCNVLGLFFSHLQSFLFTTAFNWYTLFLGSYINFHKIFRMFMILLGLGLMFFGIGSYLFDRKNL